MVEHLIGRRERLAVHAVRLSPPSYITNELGERPSDLTKGEVWDREALGIENYRRQYAVRDRDSALGDRPEERMQRVAWEHRQRELERAQRTLDRSRSIERGASFEIGL